MKKLTAVLILILSFAVLVGCHSHTYSTEWSNDAKQHWHIATCHEEKADVQDHAFVANGTDAEGNALYVCSACGYAHQHVYDAENWEHDAREHWHAPSCGHQEAPLFKEEHDVDDETGLCTICGYNLTEESGYEVAFAYYVVDDKGNPVVDENTGSYIEVGVTYTNVDVEGSLEIDTVNGATLYEGDKFSFTVEKSVFCYYTDEASKPYVEVISGKTSEDTTREAVEPDENGVYTVTVTGDTVISVANVETSPSTIAGKGTQEEPFTINSVVDWLYFAMYINDSSIIDYNIGYWELTTDLDFEGESIYVVGDGFTSGNAMFCGNFNGGGHTISNFVIDNSVAAEAGGGYSNYIGLFGVTTGYVGVDSVIANLTVENATVNATAGNDDIVSAGCIIGYGVGSNVRNCTVRNSTVNVMADDKYMSFAGGMVGYLQSGMTEEGILFYASATYSVADNVTIKGTGMLYSAGGIVGRVVSYNDQVTSFILNCYSSGNVSDAVRSGGIAGEIQRYGSVQNSYSTATVSAYSSFKSAVEDQYDATAYDDRYAYAGGIVGYVENDTVVEGCFFDGNTYSTTASGATFGKKGDIVAGSSASKFADYYAKTAYLNNASAGTEITNAYLQNTLNWNEADWTFGEGYPTINQEEVARTFTIKVNVNGQDVDSAVINSQYIPLSYWYIIAGSNSTTPSIDRFYQQGTLRTFGYYFDSDCTSPVPVGYVPMNDITFYAKYSDVTDIVGKYFISSNGVSATVLIKDDGSYVYQEGAIYLEGTYSYDGRSDKLITFDNSFFSRLASTATSAQKSSYYKFWATVQDNGNLSIFDCDERYVVSSENEAQNPTFTGMARFYPVSEPLVAISISNLSFTGGYYYEDGAIKNVFEFNNDYTGTYTKYNGENLVATDRFTFAETVLGDLVISLNTNGAEFIATVEGDLLVSMEDNYGAIFSLSKIDGFKGTWEKTATTHKIYTFDGMGSWKYEHYVYLVEDGVVNATKQVVDASNGTYSVNGAGDLVLIRDGINVVATLREDGSITITEDGQPVQVAFTNVNGYMGVWYTANNRIIRYTLTIDGVNGNGVGTATLDGFEIEPLKLRYAVASNDTLYFYVNDAVYAILKYSAKNGTFDGMFYDTMTGSTTTPQTLYLYDDFTGSWVSDIQGLENVKFNGFGDYNTKDDSGNFLAVKGIVTIGNVGYDYTIDRQTDNAKFTYKGVEYTLSYNEYTDSIAVSYAGGSGVIAKADAYQAITLKNETTTYSFDGRGNFAEGGTVTANGTSGVYKIQPNGDVLLQFAGSADQTIVVTTVDGVVTGFSLNGSALYVDNAFVGAWSIPGEQASIIVGESTQIPVKGQSTEIQGSYNGVAVTMYYNGTDTVSFAYKGKEYSLVNTLGGKVQAMILKISTTLNEEVVTENIVVRQDAFYGVWTKENDEDCMLTFNGCGDSGYVDYGTVVVEDLNSFSNRYYKIVNGEVIIYDPADGSVYATFVECAKEGGAYVDTTGAYTDGERYYQLLIA